VDIGIWRPIVGVPRLQIITSVSRVVLRRTKRSRSVACFVRVQIHASKLKPVLGTPFLEPVALFPLDRASVHKLALDIGLALDPARFTLFNLVFDILEFVLALLDFLLRLDFSRGGSPS
jgi:hypothetical protein